MKIHAYLIILYAILVITGGVMGLIKAGSVASLAMGCFFGVLLLGSSVALYKQKKVGYLWAFIFTTILFLFFSYRFFKTGTFVPGGIMSIVSLLILVRLLLVPPKKLS